MNVAQLDDFGSREQFLAHARGLPRVILEGPSDVGLFKSWFEHLQADFDFLSPEDLGQGAGCTAVSPAVRYSWAQNIPALGIVDRDCLHRKKAWDLMFSPDPDAISNASGDPDVRVAALWEIEAYLLFPDLLSTWVGVQRAPQPAPIHETSSALGRALEECEALLNAAAFFASAHATRESYDDRYFKGEPADRIAELCRTKLAAGSEERQKIAAEVEQHLAAVRAAAPADPAERFVYLLRYVDTKRLLHRLVGRLRLGADAHHALRFLMAERKLRPEELERLLTEAADRFDELET